MWHKRKSSSSITPSLKNTVGAFSCGQESTWVPWLSTDCFDTFYQNQHELSGLLDGTTRAGLHSLHTSALAAYDPVAGTSLFFPRTAFERHWPLQSENIDVTPDRCMWKSMMQGSHSPVWLKLITDQSVQTCACRSDVGVQRCSMEYTCSYQTTEFNNLT